MMRLSTLWQVDQLIRPDQSNPVADAVLSHWAIQAGTPRFVRSSANFVYRCQGPAGDFFLRFTEQSEREHEAILDEVLLLRWLAEQGLCVAVPVPSAQGELVETVTTSWGTFHAVLYPALPGQHDDLATLQPEQAEQWGAALGRLHQSCRTYLATHPLRRPTWDQQLALTAALVPPDQRAVQEEQAEVAAVLRLLPVTADSYGLCHGDFELDNLLWQGDTVGMLDFDHCAYCWYVADLAYALDELAATGPGSHDPRYHAFVRGYRQVAPLDDQWLVQLPLFLRFADLLTYGSLQRALDLPITPEHPEWLATLAQKLRQWLRAYERRLLTQGAW